MSWAVPYFIAIGVGCVAVVSAACVRSRVCPTRIALFRMVIACFIPGLGIAWALLIACCICAGISSDDERMHLLLPRSR